MHHRSSMLRARAFCGESRLRILMDSKRRRQIAIGQQHGPDDATAGNAEGRCAVILRVADASR
jgi:hypothetical protein